MKPMRRLLVLLHRYVGLFLGAFLLLEALTGCAIVFEEELDALLHPQLHPPRREAPLAPVDVVLRQASAALEGNWQALALRFPHDGGAAAVALFRSRPAADSGEAPALRQVFVDVHSGAVLGQRGPNDTVLQVLKRLHADLYLGEPGMLLLLVVTFGCLLLGVTGPVLWQPKGWHPAGWFRVNWGANPLRRYLDLHKVAGFWLLPLIAATGVTSIYMLQPPLAESAVGSLFPLRSWHAPPLQLQPGGVMVSAGQAVALAQAHRPDAQLRNLRLPPAPAKPYVVELAEPGEMNDGRSGSVELRIDPASGAIVHETTRRQFSIGDHIMYWQYPLHNGHAFGLTGRILVFIGGAALTLLFATGFYLWYKKGAASAASKRRKRERARQPLPGHPAHEPDQHPV